MSEARELDLPIPPEAARQRADRFVADRSGLSRSFVQRLISEGHLTMNGLIVRASATLVPGQTLHLVIPPVSERENRPCEECICHIPGSQSCKMVYLNRRWLSKEPCKYHLTWTEYRKLIDSGAIP